VINELAGTITMITNRLLDDHVESLDLAADLAQPLPIAVLGQLLGVSISDAEGVQLKRWCDDFLLPFGRDISTLSADELARTRSAGVGLHGFVDTILSRRAAAGTDGRHLLSATAAPAPHEITSRRACRAASLQVMTMIFVVRRVRAAAMGLAPAGFVLG
jgi:cytochrome P450